MTRRDLPFPLTGSTVIVGSTNTGKTRLTADALDAWVDTHGPDGVVVLDFAPEIERDDRLIGGRLTRETRVPDRAWHGVLEAVGPRTEATTTEEAVKMARRNAIGATALLERTPQPRAVFVNDASIAFGHPETPLPFLLEYCNRADIAVLNSYDGAELADPTHPVSRAEARYLGVVLEWADRVVQRSREPREY